AAHRDVDGLAERAGRIPGFGCDAVRADGHCERSEDAIAGTAGYAGTVNVDFPGGNFGGVTDASIDIERAPYSRAVLRKADEHRAIHRRGWTTTAAVQEDDDRVVVEYRGDINAAIVIKIASDNVARCCGNGIALRCAVTSISVTQQDSEIRTGRAIQRVGNVAFGHDGVVDVVAVHVGNCASPHNARILSLIVVKRLHLLSGQAERAIVEA